MGTAAEFIALSVDLVTELADHVSFAEGATLGVPGMTAHRVVLSPGRYLGLLRVLVVVVVLLAAAALIKYLFFSKNQ